MKLDILLATVSGYLAAFGVVDRQQTPKIRDYVIEHVRIPGGASGVTLDAELTLPAGNAPVPGIVLITGSGPQNKNEELVGHKPFLVLSDHLTRSGFGVLRFDDRGVGDSTGDFTTATARDLASDAAAALSYLKAHPGILPGKTGYLGHSEGGYIAPIAQTMSAADFHVYLAGPALPLIPDVMAVQVEDIARAEGSSEKTIAQETRLVADITDALAKTENVEELKTSIPAILERSGATASQIKDNVAIWATPWARAYVHHKPCPLLEALDIPVLALFGEYDLQVSAKENAPVMEAALKHPASRTQVLEGLNHLFQPTSTGRVSEYLKIRTTIDPTALNAMTDWLKVVTAETKP